MIAPPERRDSRRASRAADPMRAAIPVHSSRAGRCILQRRRFATTAAQLARRRPALAHSRQDAHRSAARSALDELVVEIVRQPVGERVMVMCRHHYRCRPQVTPQHHPRAVQLRLGCAGRDLQQRARSRGACSPRRRAGRRSRARRPAAWRARSRSPSRDRANATGAGSVSNTSSPSRSRRRRTVRSRNRSMTTLTASRCSQVANAESPRKLPSFCQTRTNTSCVSSSASRPPVMRRTRLCTRGRCARYTRSNADTSPAAASATSSVMAVGRSGQLSSVDRSGQRAMPSTSSAFLHQLGRTDGRKVGTASAGYRKGRSACPPTSACPAVSRNTAKCRWGVFFGRIAGRADVADHLPLLDRVALLAGRPRSVRGGRSSSRYRSDGSNW